MGEIERALRPGTQRVDVVAADAALHLRKARGDLVGLARAEREQVAGQRSQRRIRRQIADRSAPTGPKCAALPSASSASIDEHVVARVAVAQRARAAGIVAGHAADGGARGGRDVDRKPQAVRLELRG